MKELQNDQLLTAIINILHEAPVSEQSILFLPAGVHPVWEDQQTVFDLAVNQIFLPLTPLPGETPLAYIGMHSRIIFTGKRNSLGFLITDHRVLVQANYSVLSTPEKAAIFKFTNTQQANELADLLWREFEQKIDLDIPEEQLWAMPSVLHKVLEVVLPALQQSGYLPDEIKAATVLADRIQELGLESIFKSPAQNEKLFTKVAAKFGTDGIRYGTIDKTLFGGVYGLVLTHSGIVSRDLMEAPEQTSWEAVRQNPATAGEETDIILTGSQKHIIPKPFAGSRNALITLINELAAGKVS